MKSISFEEKNNLSCGYPLQDVWCGFIKCAFIKVGSKDTSGSKAIIFLKEDRKQNGEEEEEEKEERRRATPEEQRRKKKKKEEEER